MQVTDFMAFIDGIGGTKATNVDAQEAHFPNRHFTTRAFRASCIFR
jgi:hypothetical protein